LSKHGRDSGSHRRLTLQNGSLLIQVFKQSRDIRPHLAHKRFQCCRIEIVADQVCVRRSSLPPEGGQRIALRTIEQAVDKRPPQLTVLIEVITGIFAEIERASALIAKTGNNGLGTTRDAKLATSAQRGGFAHQIFARRFLSRHRDWIDFAEDAVGPANNIA